MSRASKADAARHHQELIDAASRLFRERGVDGVGLADLMGAIGLSRGGFYKHFASKEALVAAAVDAAFDQHLARVEQPRAEFLDFCLSPENRDDPGAGCPSPFVTDVVRTDAGDQPREAFVRGTHRLIDALRETATDEQNEALLADLALTVGAVLLARATAGDPLSDEILGAARRRLA